MIYLIINATAPPVVVSEFETLYIKNMLKM